MTWFRTRRLAIRWTVGVAALVAPATACGAQGRRATGAAGDRTAIPDVAPLARRVDTALAGATFDTAWATVGTALRSRGARPPDWDSLRLALRPQAVHARTDAELRAVIARLLGRLGESHFAILPDPRPRSAVEPGPNDDRRAIPGRDAELALGTVGMEPRLVDGRLVVWRLAPNGPAMRAGIRPGWAIERIGDRASARAIAAADSVVGEGPRRIARLRAVVAASNDLRGAPGTSVALTLRDGSSGVHAFALTRDRPDGAVVRFGNLPPLTAPFEVSVRARPGGACVLVMRFEYWMPAIMPKLDQAMDSARTCAGVVMDLRGNLGGVAGMVMGVGGYFLDEPRSLGTMRTAGQELRFVANPRRSNDAGVPRMPYAGPLAILIDEVSASTSEIFAVAMQSLGRARLFGVRSAGQALPAMATRLPNGDVLMHVIADFIAPDGRRIEGWGAVPDEVIPLNEADLRAARDAPLDAALRWIDASALPSAGRRPR